MLRRLAGFAKRFEYGIATPARRRDPSPAAGAARDGSGFRWRAGPGYAPRAPRVFNATMRGV